MERPPGPGPETSDASSEVAQARDEMQLGDFERALARIDRVLQKNPRNAQGLELQHQLRLKLCWMWGAFEPMAAWLESHGEVDDIRRLTDEYRRSLDCDGALRMLERLGARGHDVEWERIETLLECRQFARARVLIDEVSARRVDASSSLLLARLAVDAGDAGLAERLCRQAIERAPDDPAALVLGGTLAAWSGDAARADALADRALTVDHAAKSALRLKGQAALLLRDFGSALGYFEAARAGAEPDRETLILLAESYRRLGNLVRARATLREASSLRGSCSPALQMNELLVMCATRRGRLLPLLGWMRYGNSLDLLDALSALGVTPRSWHGRQKPSLPFARLRELLEEGLARLSSNRSATLTAAPRSEGVFVCPRAGPGVRAACMRVRDLLRQRGFDAAISAHDSLLTEFGGSPLVYTHRGELLLWAGRYNEAFADFEAAVRLDRTTRWAWVGLGACDVLRGSPRRALATFLRGRLHVTPGLASHVYQGEALRMLGRRRQALSAFEKGCRLQPTRISGHLNLALEYAHRGDGERARSSLGRVSTLVPGFWRASLARAALSEHRAMTDPLASIDLAGVALGMMRGNRSSSHVTWFGRDDREYAEYPTPNASRSQATVRFRSW